jgi:membrane protease YdiL (CAAX protease family)
MDTHTNPAETHAAPAEARGLRDFISLLVIPLMFLVSYLITLFPQSRNTTFMIMSTLALQVAAVAVIVMLNHRLLADAWHSYRRQLWLKVIICILGAVALHALLYGVRLLLPAAPVAAAPDEAGADMSTLPSLLVILASLPPTLAPFLEEPVFRHVLFYRFRSNAFLLVLFFFISSVLFGLIHFMNFGGNLIQTIPYMVVGACFALVYLFTKNIWYPLGIHFVFNLSNSLIPDIAFLILRAGIV